MLSSWKKRWEGCIKCGGEKFEGHKAQQPQVSKKTIHLNSTEIFRTEQVISQTWWLGHSMITAELIRYSEILKVYVVLVNKCFKALLCVEGKTTIWLLCESVSSFRFDQDGL